LAEYLKLEDDEVNNIEFDGNHTFTYGNEEWIIFEDWDDAYAYAVEYTKNMLEMENPFEMISWDNMPGGMKAYLDTDWFADAMRESYEYYVDDIRHEDASSDEYESRLEEEMTENECETEEDYIDKLCDGWEDPVKWFIDNFGNSELESVARENNLLDIDKVATAVVDTDGVEAQIAGYDGNEVILSNDFYAYRNN